MRPASDDQAVLDFPTEPVDDQPWAVTFVFPSKQAAEAMISLRNHEAGILHEWTPATPAPGRPDTKPAWWPDAAPAAVVLGPPTV